MSNVQLIFDDLCNLINRDEIQISIKNLKYNKYNKNNENSNNNNNDNNIELINVDQEQIFKSGKQYMLEYINDIVKVIEKERNDGATILRKSRDDLKIKNLEIEKITKNLDILSSDNQYCKNEILNRDLKIKKIKENLNILRKSGEQNENKIKSLLIIQHKIMEKIEIESKKNSTNIKTIEQQQQQSKNTTQHQYFTNYNNTSSEATSYQLENINNNNNQQLLLLPPSTPPPSTQVQNQVQVKSQKIKNLKKTTMVLKNVYINYVSLNIDASIIKLYLENNQIKNQFNLNLILNDHATKSTSTSTNSITNQKDITLFLIHCSGARIHFDSFKDKLNEIEKNSNIILIVLLNGSKARSIIIDGYKGIFYCLNYFNEIILDIDSNKDTTQKIYSKILEFTNSTTNTNTNTNTYTNTNTTIAINNNTVIENYHDN